MTNPDDSSTFQRDLAELASRGIRADVEPLKADMCSQFANPYEWIREYVANAYDAGASRVVVEGIQASETIAISVSDDGHGMDAARIRDFFTVFRSCKRDDPKREAVGRHGVGKLSVAAIPGQQGFRVQTSTGREAFRATLGRILDAGPIRIERITPPPKRGTRFDVVFARRESLDVVLAQLEAVLCNAARFLPIEITIRPTPQRQAVTLGSEAWTSGKLARRYCFSAGGCRCDAVLLLSSPRVHELFQSRVAISTRYDLFSLGHSDLDLPHVSVRLESPDFELPFGRHALANEHVLPPIVEHLREQVLPDYVEHLVSLLKAGKLRGAQVKAEEFEQITFALLAANPSWERILGDIPVFVDVRGKRRSLTSLKYEVTESHVLYLVVNEAPGLDLAGLPAPVIAQNHTPEAISVLRRAFGDRLVEVGGNDDLVIELPPAACGELGACEQRLQAHLRFHPHLLEQREHERQSGEIPAGATGAEQAYVEFSAAICEEAQKAQNDLATIEWRVGYLVSCDGATPCTTRRFLLRGETVVLNLHHAEVAELVKLAETAPGLAGHWGLALALTDRSQKFLEHLSPAAREDLILADALAKAVLPEQPETNNERVMEWEDVMRAVDALVNVGSNAPPSVPSWSLKRRPGSA